MRRRCTGILSVREDRRAVSTASKALLGQRRHVTYMCPYWSIATRALACGSPRLCFQPTCRPD
ncbi:unnamed protein product [Spirodela intermedia]|uniref:Uncharacterized protein n=1 Tax=Spirodela intermedia TaxID=51605 RepID=A0A7I8IS57_SPIIN|nr:unnamed protein product [Spirodela intermedia]CAA6659792.1 unnamed protein product [Spirodela intermedia]